MTALAVFAGLLTVVLFTAAAAAGTGQGLRRWLRSLATLAPGATAASVAVLVAGWLPSPDATLVMALGPGLLAATFLLVVARYRQRWRDTSRRSR